MAVGLPGILSYNMIIRKYHKDTFDLRIVSILVIAKLRHWKRECELPLSSHVRFAPIEHAACPAKFFHYFHVDIGRYSPAHSKRNILTKVYIFRVSQNARNVRIDHNYSALILLDITQYSSEFSK